MEARDKGLLERLPVDDQFRPSNPSAVAIELPALPVGDWSNPAAVMGALAGLSVGQTQAAASLAKALLSDAMIFGPLQIRCAGVVGLPKTFVPADGSDIAKKIAEECDKHFDEWFSITEQERFLRSLIVLGSSLAQIVWKDLAPGAEYQEPDVNCWDAANSVEFWYWDGNTRNFGRWIISTPSGTREPVPGDGEWIFGRLTKKSPWTDGLINPLGPLYVVRLNTLYKWAKYNDRIASPYFVLGNPTAQNTQAVNLVKQQVIAGDSILVLPMGKDGNKWTAEWAAVNTSSGTASFKMARELYATEAATAILGQNLTTSVKGGSHAAARVHDSVRQDLIEKDTRKLATIYRDQILKPFVVQSFNVSPDLAPYVVYVTKSEQDIGEFGRTFAAIAQGLAALAKIPEALQDMDYTALWVKIGAPLLKRPKKSPIPAAPTEVIDE